MITSLLEVTANMMPMKGRKRRNIMEIIGYHCAIIVRIKKKKKVMRI